MDKAVVEEKISKEDVQIIDVRGKSEYKEGHIDEAVNVFNGTLDENFGKVAKDKEVIIYCDSGNRSAVAYSLLVANGFENISNYGVGWTDWSQEG
ncbi:rhodanese-like domain-containing protein [Cyclobacterium jeungdonense]|uniref:rhodanese-like domain-containing protein n=1 Tax=Cyclobacterium jeungdonense TaxID=708087 RepID=UPI00293B97D3|nr:rhodanese-like domain-containing protein [Cyclobacterium jeungdonense]